MSAGHFDIDGAIRRVPDHPHAGILFYDLMPLFQEPAGLSAAVARIAAWGAGRAVDRVVGVEARGFVVALQAVKSHGFRQQEVARCQERVFRTACSSIGGLAGRCRARG